jgi:hypothetical protein
MRKIFTIAGLAAALMTAPGALVAARTPGPQATDPGPPSAEALAEASAEAERLIASTGAPQMFDNLSANGFVRVRHKASGLLCSFIPGNESNTLALFGSPGVNRGDDVGCQTNIGDVYMTFYATRYPQRLSAQDAADSAAAAIRQRFPGARPYTGPVATSVVPGVSEQAAVRFSVMDGPVPSSTHAITVKIGDWIFKQRLTHANESELASQAVAQSSWTEVLKAAVKTPGR